MLISHVDATTLDDIRNRLVNMFNVNYQAHIRGVSYTQNFKGLYFINVFRTTIPEKNMINFIETLRVS